MLYNIKEDKKNSYPNGRSLNEVNYRISREVKFLDGSRGEISIGSDMLYER